MATTQERFEEKWVPEPNSGCHLWTAYVNEDGYGQFLADGRVSGAHRYAWRQKHGSIPQGMNVLHKCDVPCCVNPDHLFLGTQRDNVTDMLAKGRQASPHSKLNAQQVREMRERRSAGEGQESLAAAFGVCKRTVELVTQRKTWRHLP